MRLLGSTFAALAVALLVSAGAAPARAALTPNPLGTFPPPPPGNPLAGARWFVDGHWGLAARQVRAWRGAHPAWARTLEQLARQPEAKRYGGFTPAIERTGPATRSATAGASRGCSAARTSSSARR